MVSRHEKHPVLPKRREGPHDLPPLRIRVTVFRALNRVAYCDHEVGMIRVRLPPCLFVNARDRFAGPIAQDGETETRVRFTTRV